MPVRVQAKALTVLKQRVVTGAILAIVFTAFVILSPLGVFSYGVAAIVMVGAWEWSNLGGLQSFVQRCTYVIGLAFALLASVLLTKIYADLTKMLLLVACIWWAVCLLWVQSYPHSALLWQHRWVRLAMGLCVLIPVWHALVSLRTQDYGNWTVLTLIGLVAAADTGAYFSGRAFGRHKLAPKVSPGKTWEGVMGGALCAAVLLLAIALIWLPHLWLQAVAVAIPVALVSVLGDLLESMLKRHRGIKDSGNILPGHGGVLDRVDGLVAAAPLFALILLHTAWVAS